MNITDKALDAAHAYDLAHRHDPGQPHRTSWTRVPDDQVRRLLAGAAPVIAAEAAAAERARIRDLAISLDARYDETAPCSCGRINPRTGGQCAYVTRPRLLFADRLDGQP